MVRAIFIWGAAGSLAGLVVGMIGASLYAAASQMPGREGGPGVFAAGVGIVGALLGLACGIVYGCQRNGVPLWHAGGIAALALLLLAATLVSYRIYYTGTQEYFRSKYFSVPLHVELRFVESGGAPVADAAVLEEGLEKATPVQWNATGVSGVVPLFQVTSNRVLVIKGQTTPLRLPAFPGGKRTEWSDWAHAGKGMEVRYRLSPD